MCLFGSYNQMKGGCFLINEGECVVVLKSLF
jgi:hypothetical protein